LAPAIAAITSPSDSASAASTPGRTHWLIGRVKEQVAIGKLKPMLEAGRVDAAGKLPGQGVGEFSLVREKEATAMRAEPSLIPTAGSERCRAGPHLVKAPRGRGLASCGADAKKVALRRVVS
jgi:hypothetical protein